MDDQIGPAAGVDLEGRLVPGVFEEIGDDVLEVFLGFARLEPLEHGEQIGLERLYLVPFQALLEVGLVQGFCGAVK